MNGKKVVLVIMDGVGYSKNTVGNAVYNANTPTLDYLLNNHPAAYIKAHGTAVGLPSDDDMGNSEVGHNAMGCGQVYSQGAKLVNESIDSGKLFASPTWNLLIDNCTSHGSTLHFIGLLSDGNVHSNINHLKEMLIQAKKQEVRRARIHILLDGRDVPPRSALQYVDDLDVTLSGLNDTSFDARIASGGGRMKTTMDRYGADWEMVKRGWETHVLGAGRMFDDATAAIETYRKEYDVDDQYLPPFVIAEENVPVGPILDDDSVILFNFRGDRAMEISQAFDHEVFDKFERVRFPKIVYAGMLQYDGDLKIPSKFLVAPPEIRHTLSELLIEHKANQFAVSETQKFGHVTYFWNGNRSEKFDEAYETFYEIDSDKVPFNQRPWMKSADVADEVIRAIDSKKYDFIRCNFPNGDMVGHTGDYDATVIGVESVDLAIGRILEVVKESREDIVLMVTADHGNADEMIEKGVVKTAHTLNPVPFVIYSKNERYELSEGSFGLANIAPTIVDVMGIKKYDCWEGSMLK